MPRTGEAGNDVNAAGGLCDCKSMFNSGVYIDVCNGQSGCDRAGLFAGGWRRQLVCVQALSVLL